MEGVWWMKVDIRWKMNEYSIERWLDLVSFGIHSFCNSCQFGVDFMSMKKLMRWSNGLFLGKSKLSIKVLLGSLNESWVYQYTLRAIKVK